MSISVVLDSGVWHLDARVRVQESRVQSHDSGVRPHLRAIQEGLQLRQKLSRRKVTSHILRHSHVVNALMAVVPMPMIQKQVGQNRLSTTEIYATVALALV